MQHGDTIIVTGRVGNICTYTIKIFWFLYLHKHSEDQIRNCCQTLNGRAEKLTQTCAEEAEQYRNVLVTVQWQQSCPEVLR